MGNNLSSLLGVLDERTRRGHEYSGNTISGQARVQNGDTYRIQNYYSRHVPSPDSLIRGSRADLNFEEAGWSRKRKRVSEDDDEGETLGREGCTQLDRAVAHLGELAMSLKDQKKDGDAQRILQWIRLLLVALEDGVAMSLGQHTEDELATLQKGLLRADRVMVNSTPLARRKAFSQVIETTRKRSVVKLGKWQICLDTLTCKSLDGEHRNVIDSYSSLRLDALSPASAETHSIAAFFGETVDYNQRIAMHPTILAYRVVDDDSEIFEFIKHDDLQGLKGLLAEQRATVRDCDQLGRSLLNYASYYCSPECCKFLVGIGADVDRIERGVVQKTEHWTPLSAVVTQAMSYKMQNYAERAVSCTRVLIEAGADSNVHETDDLQDVTSAISQAIVYAAYLDSDDSYIYHDLEGYLDLLLKGAFDDLRTLILEDGSLWQQACIEATPAVLRKLLGSGCDGAAKKSGRRESNVDREIGWNSLFFVVLESGRPWSSNAFESIQILLDASADPFIRDEAGLTLFDHVEIREDELGSYARDLWYCALQRAGIDASGYLEMYPRKAKYNMSYRPQHYRAMCYLDHWDDKDLDRQVQQILSDHPWSEEEAEALNSIACEIAANKRQFEEANRRKDKWFKETYENGGLGVHNSRSHVWQLWLEHRARRLEWDDYRYGSEMWLQHRTLEEYMALDREWEEEGIAWVEEHRKEQSRRIMGVDF